MVGITKAYTTRVGAGPFPTELTDADGDRLVDVGREFGTVTGRRRRAGWLDCVMLRHAARLNSLTELALTKLDVLDGFDSVKVCTGYRLDGRPLDHYPDRSDLLARVEPVYETLDGWGTGLGEVREPDDLPPPAQALIELVEREVGIPVRVVGVGADRDDYVLWSGRDPALLDAGDVGGLGRHDALRAVARGRAAGDRGARRRSASSPPPTPRRAASGRRSSTTRSSPPSASASGPPTTTSPPSSTSCRQRIGPPAGSWIHYGLTSSDVVDTALCWAMRDAADVVLASTDALLTTMVELARAHLRTVMIGRTHGIHAEPTTFGAKVALWALQLDRDRTRLDAARASVAVCKLSGAVGTYSNVDPAVERHVGERLGLRPVPATQVIARDRHAELLYALASVAATCELVAVELRHLQRTEVSEAIEGFKPGQKGSSAMPHKRNPISAETISGLARVVRSNLHGRVAGHRPVARAGHLPFLCGAHRPARLVDAGALHDPPPRSTVARPPDRRAGGCARTSGRATVWCSANPSCWPSWPPVRRVTTPTGSCSATP